MVYVDRDVRLSHVQSLIADTNRGVALVFSAPRTELLHHYRYAVRIDTGAVDVVVLRTEMD
jgi:hypothetical protein